jgi:hypothetical protein
MKQIFTLTIFLIICFLKLEAQTTDVIIGGQPTGLLLDGNDLYIAEYGRNSIAKIDISEANPTRVLVAYNIENPISLLLNGNELYIAGSNKISKINLNHAIPINANVVVTGLNVPTGMELNGNDLYIAEFGADKISKIDLNDATPITVDVVTGLDMPFALKLIENELYIAEANNGPINGGNKISKININETTPAAVDVVTGLKRPVALELIGSDLYILEQDAYKISKIDLSQVIPNTVDVITELEHPFSFIINGNDFYISSYYFFYNRVYKVSVNTLSLNKFSTSINNLKLYPNPSIDFVKIKGLIKNENYTIYNLQGTDIINGNISENEGIYIKNLTSGLYFLKFENGNTLKFIKE